MSPEQVKSLPVTAASDVFSLGGTLYFAATGRHPFDGEGDYEVLVAVCRFLGLRWSSPSTAPGSPRTPTRVSSASPRPNCRRAGIF